MPCGTGTCGRVSVRHDAVRSTILYFLVYEYSHPEKAVSPVVNGEAVIVVASEGSQVAAVSRKRYRRDGAAVKARQRLAREGRKKRREGGKQQVSQGIIL